MTEGDNTDTNISALRGEPARQHPLPWVLFGVAVLALALVGGLLAKRLNLETRRANEEKERSAGLQAQNAQLLKSKDEVDAKIADAEAKVKKAEDAQFEAEAKVKKMETERDKLVKELEAQAKKVAAAETKTPEKKKKKKKKKR